MKTYFHGMKLSSLWLEAGEHDWETDSWYHAWIFTNVQFRCQGEFSKSQLLFSIISLFSISTFKIQGRNSITDVFRSYSFGIWRYSSLWTTQHKDINYFCSIRSSSLHFVLPYKGWIRPTEVESIGWLLCLEIGFHHFRVTVSDFWIYFRNKCSVTQQIF